MGDRGLLQSCLPISKFKANLRGSSGENVSKIAFMSKNVNNDPMPIEIIQLLQMALEQRLLEHMALIQMTFKQ